MAAHDHLKANLANSKATAGAGTATGVSKNPGAMLPAWLSQLGQLHPSSTDTAGAIVSALTIGQATQIRSKAADDYSRLNRLGSFGCAPNNERRSV